MVGHHHVPPGIRRGLHGDYLSDGIWGNKLEGRIPILTEWTFLRVEFKWRTELQILILYFSLVYKKYQWWICDPPYSNNSLKSYVAIIASCSIIRSVVCEGAQKICLESAPFSPPMSKMAIIDRFHFRCMRLLILLPWGKLVWVIDVCWSNRGGHRKLHLNFKLTVIISKIIKTLISGIIFYKILKQTKN